ncbi:hypothetical protein PG994_002279 [Apiospora phragmitis]|uniref:Uncharacterized protein n=1 Tax=Apiospora phragmitis TaxID=2905665 RepID=A0ABR1WVY2_9PEZI
MSGSKLTTATSRRLRLEWPLLEDADRQDLTGVHAVLVVICHLYTFLDNDDIPDNETQPAILQAARILFDKNGPVTIDIFKSTLLNEHLWSRDAFHLWQRRDWARPLDQLGDWQLTDETHLDDMVCESLVMYDGTTTLDECVSAEFGFFDDHMTQWQWFRLPCFRAFIRVHYQPRQARKFKDVRSFTITCQSFESKNETPHECQLKIVKERYTIVAAVRLGRHGEEDVVRTYNASGAYLLAPKDATSIIDDKARIGEDGHEWLLFYSKLGKGQSSRISDEKDEPCEEVAPSTSITRGPSGKYLQSAKATSVNPEAEKGPGSPTTTPTKKSFIENLSSLAAEIEGHDIMVFSNIPSRRVPDISFTVKGLPVCDIDGTRKILNLQGCVPPLPTSIAGLFPTAWLRHEKELEQSGPEATSSTVPQPFSQPAEAGGSSSKPHESKELADQEQTGALSLLAPRPKIMTMVQDAGRKQGETCPALSFAAGPMPLSHLEVTPVERRRLAQEPWQKAYDWLVFTQWHAWSKEHPEQVFQQLGDLTQRHYEECYKEGHDAPSALQQELQQMGQQEGQPQAQGDGSARSEVGEAEPDQVDEQHRVKRRRLD